MGTYLATGIVYKIYINKKEIESKKLSMENILKALEDELDISRYVFSEDKDSICWEIKPEMLEGNFPEFLEAQFQMYGDKIDSKAMTEIMKAHTGKKIIALAEKVNYSDFQMVDNILDSLCVMRDNGFSDYVVVNYHMITFFLDGKIIMECYHKILHYFEKNIRLQQSKYPVVSCLKVMITS